MSRLLVVLLCASVMSLLFLSRALLADHRRVCESVNELKRPRLWVLLSNTFHSP